MLVKWFILCLVAMPVSLTNGNERKCPVECTCNMDGLNRFQTICTKGGLTRFPAESIDIDVQVIVIQGPRNSVTTGNLLRHFHKLEELRITDSNVPAIGPECLWGLQHLKILDFSKNNISLIQQRDFRGQNNLHELDLSKNKIIKMASSVFCDLTELKRLNLADNSIGELVQRIFFMLSKLKYLDLSRNPLQDLPPDVFRDVSQLKVFKCRNCQLKKINPQLYNLLPSLSELDLGRNEFKFLDKDEFRDVKHLSRVLLDGNQLSVVVDELFRMQKSLKHLDLSYNRLAKVPNDSFLHLTNLTFLDLSYNKLVRLEPQSVRRLSNLRTLNISGNIHMDLHEIRDTFELLPHLTHLSIADMGILPVGLLVPFKHLRYLNISGNHLDIMSLQVIEPCQELEFLDLSRNQLHGINADIVLRIQAIRNVRLDNNPLICDECHMGKLIDVVRQLQWKWETYPICFLPKTLRGAEITDLDTNGLDRCLDYITDEEQNAASTSHANFLERGGLNTLAILGGIIFVLIAIIIISVAICYSKHRARYYTREDHLNGSEDKCLEKNLETTTITAQGNGKTNTQLASPQNGSSNNATTPYTSDSGVEAMSAEPLNPSNGRSTNEINFKFPIDDRVCTIDELVAVPPAPPPPTKQPTGAGNQDMNSGNLRYTQSPLNCGSTTARAAVAAAATVIAPGAPSAAAPTMITTPMTPTHMKTTLPPEAIVVVLPPPPINEQFYNQQQRQQQQQQQLQHQHHHQQQQLLHLTTLEPLVSKLDKQAAWEEVLKKAQSLQLASAQKTWTYARDSLFGLWKSRTLGKRDNARKTGSAGGKDCIMDEVDLLILDIMESDSAVIDGLNLPESYGNSENLPSAESDSRISMTEETPAHPPANIRKRKSSTKFPSETLNKEKKCRLELLQVEIYYRKLQCLKLERELQLPTSDITREIRAAETANIPQMSMSLLLEDV